MKSYTSPNRSKKPKPTNMRVAGWNTYFNLGREVMPRLDARKAWPEVALLTGMTRQAAYFTAAVALGKVVWRMRREAMEQ